MEIHTEKVRKIRQSGNVGIMFNFKHKLLKSTFYDFL